VKAAEGFMEEIVKCGC